MEYQINMASSCRQLLVDTANRLLANSTGGSEFRVGVCSLIEAVLLESRRYRGFTYLTQAEVPNGELPGIRENWYKDGFKDKFAMTDPTRRKYL